MSYELDCTKCDHCQSISGNEHKKCNNLKAIVKGNNYGVKMGWFFWPVNYDPVWLISCNGFSNILKDEINEK
jgi:hypothetical protein